MFIIMVHHASGFGMVEMHLMHAVKLPEFLLKCGKFSTRHVRLF
jgi:hypothetical protein